jgi:hypothetical protein
MAQRWAPLVGVALVVLVPACGGDDESVPSSKKQQDLIVETDKPSADAQEQAPEQQEANEKADAPVPQDDESTEKPEKQPDDDTPEWSTENEPRLTVSQQDVYEEAKILCGLNTPREVARDFSLTTTNPDVIAKRYARGYFEALKPPAYVGCFDGLTK